MVYLGKFHNGFKIAVKYLKQTEQMKKEELIKQFENEVKTLSTYRHDNVVHLLGYSIDGPSQCLVSKCMCLKVLYNTGNVTLMCLRTLCNIGNIALM